MSQQDDMQGVAAEFFAGMGLVRLAAESCSHSFRIAYANDIDASKARLYRTMFDGEDHFDHRDISKVAANDIPPAQLWTASFPCTDLSLAGSRGGIRAGQSGAVWELLRLLEETPLDRRPTWLFFENVVGLLSSNQGEDVRALVSALNALGYGVDAMRVNAVHFTPQSRPRLFLIATASHSDHAPPRAKPDAVEPCEARPRVIIDAMRAAPELFWHARELPPLPMRNQTLENIIEPVATDSSRWWSPERVEYFRNQIHPNHIDRVNDLEKAARRTHVTAFRRVRAFDGVKRSVAEIRFDGIAGCLRTPKGGSAKQILVQLGDGEFRVRHLTARECLRLQGVDTDPPANATEDEMLFALGDAVCVPAVRWALNQLTNQSAAPETIFTLADAPIRSAPASNIAIATS